MKTTSDSSSERICATEICYHVIGAKDPVTWYSSNKRVVTVTNGLVVGKGKGTAYIYAYVNGCKLGCKVTVTSVNS